MCREPTLYIMGQCTIELKPNAPPKYFSGQSWIHGLFTLAWHTLYLEIIDQAYSESGDLTGWLEVEASATFILDVFHVLYQW